MVTYSEGTIRKRQRPDGSWEWEAVLTATDGDKKRHPSHRTGVRCDPPKETEKGRGRRVTPSGRGARQAMAELKTWREKLVTEAAEKEAEKETHDATDGRLVLEFIDYYWSTRNVSEVTMDGYRNLRRHLAHPTLHKPINALEPADVQAWITAKINDGIGGPTIKKAFDQLKFACRWGVKMHYITLNPCDPVTPPKKAHREPNPLDGANLLKLNNALDNLWEAGETQARLSDVARLALLTGMRLGEICALSWDDIDGGANGTMTTAGYIHVNNTVVAPKGGSKLKPYTKNNERRDVPLTQSLIDFLGTRRSMFVYGEGEDLSGRYVFALPSNARKYPSCDYIGHQWNMLAAIAGLRGVQGLVPHFHDLRHTFATQALINGLDVVTVAGILGHKDTATTLRYYARWMPNANREAMNKIDSVLW